MRYQDAVRQIHADYVRNWGGFWKPLPQLETLPVQEAVNGIAQRLREMQELESKISVFEVSRYVHEHEVLQLLLVVCLWGSWEQDVPIDESDLSNINSAINSLCVAGITEEGADISDVTRRLVEDALKSRQLPTEIQPLLLPS